MQVCLDVMRRCPVGIEFSCPPFTDRREYDHAVCNIALNHGCAIVLVSNKQEADSVKDRQTDWQTDRPEFRQTDRHTHRQTDRQTDRQTERQTDRQTHTHTHTHTTGS